MHSVGFSGNAPKNTTHRCESALSVAVVDTFTLQTKAPHFRLPSIMPEQLYTGIFFFFKEIGDNSLATYSIIK